MRFDADFRMTIDGNAVAGASEIDVINPATGRAFATAPKADHEQLEAAIAAARLAFPRWRNVPWEDRAQLLVKCAEAIRANVDALTELFVREQGRPLSGARGEIIGGAAWFSGTAKLKIPIDVTEDSDRRRVEVHHEPLGVVCGIVPWNAPFLLACWKIAPALLTGNTIVVKPSPYTPLSTLKLGELLASILPPGVLNIVSGDDALGPKMTLHPGFAKISFTGSTATGKRVMEAAAGDLKRVTLELGGNDAAIVLPDVDIDIVAPQLFVGAFYNTGQVCIASKRLYIHGDVYDALRDRLLEIARNAKLGDGLTEGAEYGPLQNLAQYDRVKAMIESARREGLVLLQGGNLPDEGYFLPFTFVDNPPDDAAVVTEEAFGPLLPLLRFNSIDDVVERANSSEYGLAGAVWTNDLDSAVHIAHRLDTGTVWINQNLQTHPMHPLAGHKHSGIGVENGLAGLVEFTQAKTIFVPK